MTRLLLSSSFRLFRSIRSRSFSRSALMILSRCSCSRRCRSRSIRCRSRSNRSNLSLELEVPFSLSDINSMVKVEIKAMPQHTSKHAGYILSPSWEASPVLQTVTYTVQIYDRGLLDHTGLTLTTASPSDCLHFKVLYIYLLRM